MKDFQVIGITGVAQAGKDTLCKVLIKEFSKDGKKAKRFALADILKQDLRESLIKDFNIDVFDCNKEEKELIRPALVEYGKRKRTESNGTYWINLLEGVILEDYEREKFDAAIITDVRYKEYTFDELDWIKNLGGVLVHVTRTLPDGSKLEPPNEDERANDPIMKELADFRLTCSNMENIEMNHRWAGVLYEQLKTKSCQS